jgi:hypothetical protein
VEQGLGDADTAKGLREIFGNDAVERYALLGQGMQKRQALGVETQSIESDVGPVAAVFDALAVANVTGDRMVDAAEMTTDLMAAPGLGISGHEGKAHAVRHEERLVFGYGFDVGAPFPLRHGAVDEAALGRLSSDECEVSFVDSSLFERGVKCTGVLRGQSENEHSARRAVESMNRVHPLPNCIARQVERERRSSVIAAVNRKTRGLVYDDNSVVSIEHLD